jgi:hypothetical protein
VLEFDCQRARPSLPSTSWAPDHHRERTGGGHGDLFLPLGLFTWIKERSTLLCIIPKLVPIPSICSSITSLLSNVYPNSSVSMTLNFLSVLIWRSFVKFIYYLGAIGIIRQHSRIALSTVNVPTRFWSYVTTDFVKCNFLWCLPDRNGLLSPPQTHLQSVFSGTLFLGNHVDKIRWLSLLQKLNICLPVFVTKKLFISMPETLSPYRYSSPLHSRVVFRQFS